MGEVSNYAAPGKDIITMSMRFKIDILQALKEAGYNTYKISKDNLLSQSTVQKLRTGEPVSWKNIEKICELLNVQPGDILEFCFEN